MRFLHFGDFHNTPNTPENRIDDDFQQTMEDKAREIREIGIKHKVSAFLQPGDFLDAPKFGYEFLSQVINRWSDVNGNELMFDFLTKKITEEELVNKLNSHIPIIGAIGNHELFGYSIKSYPKTSLAFLERIGFMQIASKENPIEFVTEDGATVHITASHYHHDIDTDDGLHHYIIEEKKADFHVHIVHGYLTSKDMGNVFDHTTVDKIKHTKADITLAGHDHIGFKILNIGGKYFGNTGAIPRLTNDKKEMKRRPKVLLIDITKEKGIVLKTIPLKSAKKGEDVLDRSKIEQAQESKKKLEKIRTLINQANLQKSTDITDIIKSVSEVNNVISEELRDSLIEKVVAKMDEMGRVSTVPSTPYIVEKLVLENFQSHEHTEMHFSKGLNTIVGESSNGKSAIVRAFDWIYENNGKNPRRFIKNGKDFARATVYLSNGYIISRVVEKKKSGKNGYEIFNPHTGTSEYSNTKSLPIVQEILGNQKIKIDNGKEIDINFMRQGVNWFFIGDTATERAKLIGSIYGTHYSDAVMRDLEQEHRKLKTQEKEQEKKLSSLDKDLEEYTYLPALKNDVDKLKAKQDALMLLMKKHEEVKKLLALRSEIKERLEKEKNVCKSLDNLEEISRKTVEAKRVFDKYNQIIKLCNQGKEIINRGKRARITATQLSVLPNIQEKLNQVKVLNEERKRAFELHEKAKALTQKKVTIEDKLKELHTVMKQTENVQQLSSTVSHVKSLLEKERALRTLMSKREGIKQEGAVQRETLNKAKKHTEGLVEQYKELLASAGTCPVCHGTIDNAVINRVVHNHFKQGA